MCMECVLGAQMSHICTADERHSFMGAIEERHITRSERLASGTENSIQITHVLA